ncbi:cytochrome c oxidase subunit II [Massilia endophytica]|uniref:cytochrome c oxidase subunit II n=1 Tax=Massilia endophytica TaxID=2899220 RepID=UPI001E4A47D6|nr:cytochrome c oxidase subunit II [Massilia endophytica]UGQ44639.1 cytochrome c oxidase subunit II [Massilia endophytica]
MAAAIAIALVAIAIGSLAFHYASPWWLTPIASNWHAMDDALLLTFAITGVVFVALHLFVAYAVMRFRHQPGRVASREHGNRKLEWWLIGLTTLGIIGLLAPGLTVYAHLITPPANASVFEVMGQQWQWHYRLPGKDGKLGVTDVRFMQPSNPFGIDPEDPKGQDDVLVDGQELHLPQGRPALAQLRAQDVLHDFYVPQFRTRMNMVPGMVTHFWFTPEKNGRFEVLCAQLCGVGHSNMRSYVVVEDMAAYENWLARQPTFGGGGKAGVGGPAEPGKQGRLVAQGKGCLACHSVDGTAGVGPSWKGLFGRSEAMADGKSVAVDEDYLKESITAPQARIVKGFAPVMPPAQLSEAETAAVVEYIKSLH